MRKEEAEVRERILALDADLFYKDGDYNRIKGGRWL